MSRATADDQLRFLLSCVKHSNSGKIDFVEVARECGIVSKGAAAKRYERLMKANGILPTGERTTSTSVPKEKSRAAIAKAAAAKRRKIEGDLYDIKQDDEEDMKPMLPKEELSEYQHIKSESEANQHDFMRPQYPTPPLTPYFSHPIQPPVMYNSTFHPMPSPTQSPMHQSFHRLPLASPIHQQYPQYPFASHSPVQTQFLSPSMLSSPPLSHQTNTREGPSSQPASFIQDPYTQDSAKELENLNDGATISSPINSQSQSGDTSAIPTIIPPLTALPLSPQEVVFKLHDISTDVSTQVQYMTANLPPAIHSEPSRLAGEGIENSILISD